MEQNFLLTFSWNSGFRYNYAWFEFEDDLKQFIKENDITVYEAIEILNSREIELYND